MGWLKKAFKKAERSVKKSVKKVGKSLEAAVTAPYKTLEAVAKGKSGTEVLQEIGKGVGGAMSLTPAGFLINTTDGQKLLRSDLLNDITLGTGKELAKTGSGFQQLQKTGEADKAFYQSLLALGAKAGAVYGGSLLLAAPSASATVGAIDVTAQTGGALASAQSAAVTSQTLTLGGVAASGTTTAAASWGIKDYLAGTALLKSIAGIAAPGAPGEPGESTVVGVPQFGSAPAQQIPMPFFGPGAGSAEQGANAAMPVVALAALGVVGFLVVSKISRA